MSEPTRPPSTPPSPFDRPGDAVAPGSGRAPGIRKPLLIGCGFLLVLVFIAVALFVVFQNDIAAWVFEAMHAQLEDRLPEDLPPDLHARYEDAFEIAVAAAKEGDYSPEDLQRVQREFSRVMQAGGSRLSVEEVERLTVALEAVRAGRPEAPPVATDEGPPAERASPDA